jgi:hypothetical protein
MSQIGLTSQGSVLRQSAKGESVPAVGIG